MYLLTNISVWFIPCLILLILLVAQIRKVPTYETFVEGAKEGINMTVSILPFLLGMIVAIAILRSSGALDAFIGLITPLLTMIGVPPEIVPLALVRPISGTAALGVTTELTAHYGPDSFIGRLAGTMQGSTDTTLYIITVYFGAVGIKKIGNALKIGLLADLISIIASILIVTLVFG